MCKDKCQVISTPVTTNYTTTRTRVTYEPNDGSGNSYSWNCNGNDNCGYCPNMGTNFNNASPNVINNVNGNGNCVNNYVDPNNGGYDNSGFNLGDGSGACSMPDSNSCTNGGFGGQGGFGQIIQMLLAMLCGGGNGSNSFSF